MCKDFSTEVNKGRAVCGSLGAKDIFEIGVCICGCKLKILFAFLILPGAVCFLTCYASIALDYDINCCSYSLDLIYDNTLALLFLCSIIISDDTLLS
jgi:hypothetical protein